MNIFLVLLTQVIIHKGTNGKLKREVEWICYNFTTILIKYVQQQLGKMWASGWKRLKNTVCDIQLYIIIKAV